MNHRKIKGKGWATANWFKHSPKSPSNFIAGHPKAALLFCSLVVLDVVCGYVLLFLLDIKIENR